MLSISGELIVSRYVAETKTNPGHFGHVGLCQLRTYKYHNTSYNYTYISFLYMWAH